MKRRLAVILAAVVALTVGVAGPALAFWAVTSSGATATAAADMLGRPSVSTSGVTATTVTISVTAKPATGPTPTGYRVARTAPTAVTTVCTITGPTGSCSDTAPVSGQANTYAVYAQLSGTSWESPVPQTVTVAVPGDTVAPDAPVISFPASGGAYNATTWAGALSGTASDNAGGSGIATTQVAIQSTSGSTSGKYWSGSGFTATTLTWLGTNSGTGNTSWTYALGRPADGSYTAQARSTDLQGNTGAVTSASFTIDTAVPAAPTNLRLAAGFDSGISATDGITNVSRPTFTGTALAGSTIRLYSGSTLVGTATADAGGAFTVTPTAAFSDGTYAITASASDAAGNESAKSTATSVTIDTVGPTTPPAGTDNKYHYGDTAAPGVDTMSGEQGTVTAGDYLEAWITSPGSAAGSYYSAAATGGNKSGTVAPFNLANIAGTASGTSVTITFYAVDAAGNRSSGSKTLTFTDTK